MKVMRNNLYKDMASILCSDKKGGFRTSQNTVLFSSAVRTYPSKSPFCLVINRLMHFFERNVNSIQLILEIMRDEGEDEEIITNIEFLQKNPTIKTQAEVNHLCEILSDYIKYSKLLKVKNSFISTFDLIDDDNPENIHQVVESTNELALAVVNAYNSASFSTTAHTFDTNDPDGMKIAVANAKDKKSTDQAIITSIRGVNDLLSPGYLVEQVYVWAGLPGQYKSGMLLNGHVDACRCNPHIVESMQGKTPISVYISMENTMTQTISRLWSILFPNADLAMFSVDQAVEMIDKELTSHGWRSVILYYGYREKSTYEIAQILQSFNNDKYQVRILFFDYLKRVRPGRTDALASTSEKAELGVIMNEWKTISAQLCIPIVTGHQLNRVGAIAIDDAMSKGNIEKAGDALGRGHLGSSWDIIEVTDWLGYLNIMNDGENKMLMAKAMKQREQDNSQDVDTNIIGIFHPFLTPHSFALKSDIMENVSLSIPIYLGKRTTNFLATI